LGSIGDMALEYRFSSALVARLMGAVLVVAGAAVLLVGLLVSLLGLPTTVLSVAVVLAVLAFLLSGLLLTRTAAVVRLEEAGYRVRLIRGAGVHQARWVDVEDVVASTIAGERCVVLRLRDGRATTVPVDVLAGSSDDFVRALQQHLNRGHGYRPLS
jgi:hypothetical protein